MATWSAPPRYQAVGRVFPRSGKRRGGGAASTRRRPQAPQRRIVPAGAAATRADRRSALAQPRGRARREGRRRRKPARGRSTPLRSTAPARSEPGAWISGNAFSCSSEVALSPRGRGVFWPSTDLRRPCAIGRPRAKRTPATPRRRACGRGASLLPPPTRPSRCLSSQTSTAWSGIARRA
jgi:hypothetical protein